MGDTELVKFKDGKIISGRWKVMQMLGAGGCGAVYEVRSINQKHYKTTAALKVEALDIEDGGVLKLEAEVLTSLKNCPSVVRLLDAGKRPKYCFIVMTLCGSDLMYLRRVVGKNDNKREKDRFSEETILRVGVLALYTIKQIHEVGFVHRDVKPGNIMIGRDGRDARMLFLIDYGMVRSFIVKEKSSSSIRKPRRKVLLRGTLRYCSLNVHLRLEQGRVDDLWSLLYLLIECYVGLPWSAISKESKLQELKSTITDDHLFKACPPEFRLISDHLKTLKYEDRPDYKLVYDAFIKGVKRVKTSFSAPYDWEDAAELKSALLTALSPDSKEKKNETLSKEKLEWLLYPSTNPERFSENILKL